MAKDNRTLRGDAAGDLVGRVTFNDGEDMDIPVRAVTDYIAGRTTISGGLLGSEVMENTPIGGGLVRLDPHLEAIDGGSAFTFDVDTNIPIALGNSADGLRSDVPYYVLLAGEQAEKPLEAELWTCAADALRTERPKAWIIDPVGLTLEDGTPATADNHQLIEKLEDGTEIEHTLAEFGLDPQKLMAFWNAEEERYITFGDFMGGLLILQASVGVAMQMRATRNAPLVLRTGKHFTEAMRATSKRGKFEHPDGGEFIMAGELMISADRVGALSTGVGMNKTLAYLNHLATASGYAYEPDRSCTITTSVDEILDVRKLDHTRKNRERVRRDIRAGALGVGV